MNISCKFFICKYFLIISITSLRVLYPIAFAVVRHSSINVNLSSYIKNIGYPKVDSYANNVGYNIIALDGFKTSTSLSSLDLDLTPLGTWTNLYPRIIGNTRNIYGKNSADIQNYIINKFHEKGSKIIMNAFSF